MPIKNGAANINLIPVANTGGIVSAAIRIASHVVPRSVKPAGIIPISSLCA